MNAYNPVNRIAEYTHDGKELIDEYPVLTVAIVFGLGVATGLAAASFLFEPSPPSSRYSTLTQRLGEQLMDAMSSVVPDTVLSALRKS